MAGSLGALVLAGGTGFAELLLGRSLGLVPVVDAEAKVGKHKIESKTQTGHSQTSQQKNDVCIRDDLCPHCPHSVLGPDLQTCSSTRTCTCTCAGLLSSPLVMALLFSALSGLEKLRPVVNP